MWNWLLNVILPWRWFSKKPETVTPESPTPRARPAAPVRYTRENVNRSNYYRRNGNFYSVDDDSLIEDLILLALLTDIFDEPLEAGEISVEVDIVEATDSVEIDDSVEADIAAIDAAVEEVRETRHWNEPEPYVAPEPVRTPEPSYSEPEPDRSYGGGGSSYDGGGSSYDGGGSSDSGGSSD